MRHLISSTILLCAGAAYGAGAPAPSLYAVTSAGQLVTLDTATGASKVVRVPLPSPYTTLDSLEYVNGWFYASYAGGKVVRFGFDCGDQVDLGPCGYPFLEAIATRGDGAVYASVSMNADVGAESIGLFNPANGDVTGAVPSANQSVIWDMDAIAFAPDNTLRVINLSPPRVLATFDVVTGAISDVKALGLFYAGATFSLDGSVIYGATIGDGNCNGISNLATINPLSGAEAIIGATGLTCLVGLTWGPPSPAGLGDINHDGVVNGADLGLMLGHWGTCPAGPCPGDLNCDGKVDGADLGILLGQWST